jgi:hypothetical protein
VPKEGLSSLDWQMHTRARVAISAAAAVLTGVGAEPARFHLRILEPDMATWSLASAAPGEPRGQNANTGVSKLLLHLEQVVRPVRLAVLLSSDADACAAAQLPAALRRPLAEWIRSDGRRSSSSKTIAVGRQPARLAG